MAFESALALPASARGILRAVYGVDWRCEGVLSPFEVGCGDEDWRGVLVRRKTVGRVAEELELREALYLALAQQKTGKAGRAARCSGPRCFSALSTLFSTPTSHSVDP